MNWFKKLCISAVFILPAFAEENGTVELKAGYLLFGNQRMRNVYNDGSFQVQASFSYPVKGDLEIYGSIGFLEAWGKSVHFDQKTTFWRIPVDLGLKPVVQIASYAQWYVGLGPRYFYAHQRNCSSFVDRNAGTNGIGGFINTGFNFFPTTHFVIDLFGEYSYEPIHFSSSKDGVHGRHIQVGGYYFGAAAGYAF